MFCDIKWANMINAGLKTAIKQAPILFSMIVLTACTTVPPKNTDNLCAVFREKEAWYWDAHHVYRRWGVPVPVLMAIMRQESHFVADAKPPRRWLLGIIPWFRPSSAYGYAQALDGTWDDYQASIGDWGRGRDDFADATDFIGWYSHISHNRLGIAKSDVKNLYFAYHEGHAGYRRKNHLKKRWLRQVAKQVDRQAKIFQKQLSVCDAMAMPTLR